MVHVAATVAQIVLVPGGFTGAWMWADVAALLEVEGVAAATVDLPTIGEESVGADFYADARAVRELLDGLEPPLVLCGHSYGGAVITEAASGPHPAVRELVYLTAAVPGTGDSMVSLMRTAAAQDADAEEEGVTVRDDGLALLDREAARRALFNDCERERAEEGLRRLRPMSLAGADQPVRGAAWTQLPSVYVRGTDDPMPEALAPGFLERTTEIVELPTGHCPNLYEVMVGWETDHTLAGQSSVMRDFAQIWQAADKVVYSKTLETVSTARTRILGDFDPEAVRQMKARRHGLPPLPGQNLKRRSGAARAVLDPPFN
jgi:pimeloyl-ACP methyl ester carboxylesterase